MEYSFQTSAIDGIKKFTESSHHSLLISGIRGSGKTYLARWYAKICRIDNFVLVEPTVQDIRDVITYFYTSNTKSVICIENLDIGNPAAIGAVLKFLEEPVKNVHIVVTCRSLYKLPDTISSRCMMIQIPNPTPSDILQYVKTQDISKYEFIKNKNINSVLTNFGDIDCIFRLSDSQISYIDDIPLDGKRFRKSAINSVLWEFTHFEDKTEIPIDVTKLRIKYILQNNLDKRIRNICLDCLDELDNNRIANHVVLYKFLIEFMR